MSLIVMVAAVTLCGGSAYGEGDPPPTNDLPNPFRTIAPWGDLADGRTWGELCAVAIDNDGESVWVANRCGANPHIPPGESAFAYDSCAGSIVVPVMKFDSSGKLLKSFGAGMFIFPLKKILEHIGESTRPAHSAAARAPALWEAAAAAQQAQNEPQWDSSARSAAQIEFDQRITWQGQAGAKTRQADARRGVTGSWPGEFAASGGSRGIQGLQAMPQVQYARFHGANRNFLAKVGD